MAADGFKDAPAPSQDLLWIAEIGAAHGVQGAVRLRHESLPDRLRALSPFQDRRGRPYTLKSLEPGRRKGESTVRFAGVTDRDQAEALRGVTLFTSRAHLPDDLGADEYYHADLIGLTVENAVTGQPVGTVIGLHNFGAGDLLEIKPPGDDDSFLHPFAPGFTDAVDSDSGVLRVHLSRKDDHHDLAG